MKKIYILASSPSDLTEMVDLADALIKQENHVTLAYFNEGGFIALDPRVNARIQELRDSTDEIDAYILHPGDSLLDSIAKAKLRWRAKAKILWRTKVQALWRKVGLLRVLRYAVFKSLRQLRLLKRKYIGSRRATSERQTLDAEKPSLIYQVLETAYLIALYYRNLQLFRTEMRRGDFDLALIPEDVVGSVWPLLIKAAHEVEIPILVFPYTLANQKEAVQSLKSEPAYQGRNNRIAAKLFPQWRWLADDLDLVRLPSGHIFAHEIFGVSPPAPWLMNSGYANAICVDSPASFEYFVNSGIPQSKLCVTGSVSQDHLYAQKAVKAEALAALTESLGLIGTKPLLLISGCPNQLAGKVPNCEFSTIEEVAQHVGQALAPLRDAYHIVVRPHPNYLQFAELMRPFGVASSLVPTSRLVPLSDLFVGFASATIRWAIACAVPTVNYDVFHYCYNDFGSADGVVTLTDSTAFISTLAALKPADEMYADLKLKIERNSKFWSYLDGGSADRIQAAIESECGKKPVPRTTS
jgi:hypothetical protein